MRIGNIQLSAMIDAKLRYAAVFCLPFFSKLKTNCCFYFILELWLLDCFMLEFAIERSRCLRVQGYFVCAIRIHCNFLR
jgi:hypothetical protein